MHCGQPEDSSHILQCTLPHGEGFLRSPYGQVEEDLIVIENHPDLVTLIKQDASSTSSLVMLDLTGHSEKNELCQLLNKQNRIGWYFFSWVSGRKVGMKYRSNT